MYVNDLLNIHPPHTPTQDTLFVVECFDSAVLKQICHSVLSSICARWENNHGMTINVKKLHFLCRYEISDYRTKNRTTLFLNGVNKTKLLEYFRNINI